MMSFSFTIQEVFLKQSGLLESSTILLTVFKQIDWSGCGRPQRINGWWCSSCNVGEMSVRADNILLWSLWMQFLQQGGRGHQHPYQVVGKVLHLAGRVLFLATGTQLLSSFLKGWRY